MADPTAPLAERTPEEVSEYIDNHVIMALQAADLLYNNDRGEAEYYVKNRLVAISDTYDPSQLRSEEAQRRLQRLHDVLIPDKKDY